MDDQWTRRIADRLNWDRTVAAPFTDSPPVSAATAAAADSPAAPATDPRAAVTAVMLAPTAGEFVRRAYQLALGRDPSPAELAERVRRMKLPFYTRGRMLRRLFGSVEAQLVLRAEQVRAADDARRAADHLEAVLPQVLAATERLASSVAQLRKATERTAEQLAAVGGRVDAMEARTGGPRPTG